MVDARPAEAEAEAADAELRLPPALLRAVVRHARSQPGEEVCGLIAAERTGCLRRYPVRNVSVRPAQRFEMDPREQIAAFRRMREDGGRLVAIYHSHPASPPRPSRRDLAAHGYPEAACLIVSLAGREPETRAWRIRGGCAAPLPIRPITPSRPPGGRPARKRRPQER